MAGLEAGLSTFEGVDLGALRRKSVALGDLFIDLVERRLPDSSLALASPREGARRGSQASLRHAKGFEIVQALIARNVIGDFRAPDILRFGFAPLYLRHVDVWDAVEALVRVIKGREFENPRFARRGPVT